MLEKVVIFYKLVEKDQTNRIVSYRGYDADAVNCENRILELKEAVLARGGLEGISAKELFVFKNEDDAAREENTLETFDSAIDNKSPERYLYILIRVKTPILLHQNYDLNKIALEIKTFSCNNIDIPSSLRSDQCIFSKDIDLPMSLMLSDQVDFCMPERNPLKNNEPESQHKQLISKLSRWDTNVVLMCGVSGAGKTTTAFSIASESYCIYTDYRFDDKVDTLKSYGDHSGSLLKKCKNSDYCDDKVSNYVCVDIFCRLFIFHTLKNARKIKTPLEWLYFQIGKNSNVFAKFYDQILALNLTTAVVKGYTRQITTLNAVIFIRDDLHRLNCIEHKFGDKYNFLTFTTKIYLELGVKQLLLGTKIPLQMSLEPSKVSKIGKMRIYDVFLFFDFPFYTKEEVQKILIKVLRKDTFRVSTLKKISEVLYGRARNVGGFLEYISGINYAIENADNHILDALNDYTNQLIEFYSSSIISVLENDINNHSNPFNQLVDFVSGKSVQTMVTKNSIFEYFVLPVIPLSKCVAIKENETIDAFRLFLHSELEKFIPDVVAKIKQDSSIKIKDQSL
eukprot:NODE_267_length_11298_cov_1.167872.p1 type:complete len:567 gc:universal NODE_267_length_11298_cov_1.167872:6963-8663(+)